MKVAGLAVGATLTVVLGVLLAVQLFVVRPVAGSGGAVVSRATTTIPATDTTTPDPGPGGGVDGSAAAQPDPGALTPGGVDTSVPSGPAETISPTGGVATPTGDVKPDAEVPAAVTAALRSLRTRTHDEDWGPLDVSTFDPSASLSAVTVTAGATGVGQVQVLMFHGTTYLGRGTSRPVVSAVVDTDDGAPADTIGVNYQWDPQVPFSNGVFGSEQFITFHWDGTRAVMQGTLPAAAFD